MKERISLLKFEIMSIVFTSILGTLLHFTYEISNNNLFIGAFSAVNESTWEHLKLLFFPMLITTVIGYFLFKDKYSNYLCVKVKSIFLGLAFIVIFFYTYSGIIGRNIAIVDILSFFIAVLLSHYYSYKNIEKDNNCDNGKALGFLTLLFLCFVIFTYIPPKIGLFLDPITNTYGIFKD